MSHRKKHPHPPGHDAIHSAAASSPLAGKSTAGNDARLELVVKAESSGSLEAVLAAISTMASPVLPITVIHRAIGAVNKTDILNAETGSRLIIGFEVKVLPHIQEICREHNVEVRLYSIIYRLQEDLRQIAQSLLPTEPQETVTGAAKVIALFKSSRHGIILGCEVTSGRIKLGDRFRIITAMGPVYTGQVESLHIGKDSVREATAGQQVGLKIRDFKEAHLNDLVECFMLKKSSAKPWRSSGKIVNI